MEFSYISESINLTLLVDAVVLCIFGLFLGMAIGLKAILDKQFDKKTKRVYKGSVARPQGEQQDANH